MRDNAWLKDHFANLFQTYFADVPLTNPIEIKFGREAKYRFGSIKLEGAKRVRRPKGLAQIFGLQKVQMQESPGGKVPQKSIITITSMFASEDVPVDVVSYTICHELCHYAHGFSSTNKRLFRHPHHGGVVNKEIEKRGAGHFWKAYKTWLREYRTEILAGRRRI